MTLMKSKLMHIATWIISLEILSWVSGMLTKEHVESWYVTLEKSILTPPDIVFPLVWSGLYALIGLIGWFIWHREMPLWKVKIVFILQLLLNFSWTPIFFYWHYLTLSLMVITALWLLVFYLTIVLFCKLRVASILCLPYFLWLSFAVYLNYYIVMYN